MISFLADQGHDVHLISLDRPPDDTARFTSHALRVRHPWLATGGGRPFSRIWMPVFTWRVVRRVQAGAVIAVDTAGALAAVITVRATDALHVFLSLHVESVSDVVQQRSYGVAMRVLIARRAVRRMAAVITQDDHRRLQLEAENGLAGRPLRWFIVPNS